jgi:hypothetical protein
MREPSLRRNAATHNRASSERASIANPDRFALWAVVMGVVAMVAAVASADASSGGASAGGTATTGSGCSVAQLGSRSLKRGDCGEDVRTLNWILRSKQYGGVDLGEEFTDGTDSAVRDFERSGGISADGVVEDETHAALVASMPSQRATWYGPGFFGNETACGQTLTRRTVGVAHKTLACGTKVVVRYGGRYLRTKVIDRGPFANGARWDLTQGAAERLGFETTDEVRVAAIAKHK